MDLQDSNVYLGLLLQKKLMVIRKHTHKKKKRKEGKSMTKKTAINGKGLN